MRATNKHRKSIFRYGWYIILAANIFTILTMLLSTLAWWVSPEKTTFFSYLGLGFVFILVINIIFLIFWLIFFKWRFALVSFISLLICIGPILTLFPINFSPQKVYPSSIKVLSYNAQGVQWNSKDNIPPSLKYIQESGAHIVCMQEYFSYEKSDRNNKKKILEILKEYPYYSITGLGSRNNDVSFYGMACFSKYPILRTEKIPIDSRDNAGATLYEIKINDKIISVINCHLESNRLTGDDRKLYENVLSSDRSRESIDSLAASIRKRLGPAYIKRAQQADIINKWIKNQKTDGIIVCGDMNDTPISYTYKQIKGDLEDSYAETGFGPGITYHENHFYFRIDYIMHSKNIVSSNCTVGKVKYSDHYPVWTYLRIKDNK